MAAAFEFYYFQGDGRSLREVAKQFKKSEQAINAWSQTFDWKGRVAERDAKAAAALRGRGDEEAKKLREQLLNLSKRVLNKFSARVATGKERAQMGELGGLASDYEPDAKDAAKFASLALLMMGEATGRTEHTMAPGLIDAFAAAVVATIRKHLPADLVEKVSHEILEHARLLQASQAAMTGAGGQPGGHA